MIDKIINSKKIKYSVLDDILRDYLNFKNHRNKNMNVYIDLETITKQLYTENVLESFNHVKDKDRLAISAEIINIIAHYRHYFASRKQMYSRFFLFYSNDPSKYHIEINDEYKASFYSKRKTDNTSFRIMNNVMNYSMSIVKDIVNYIPNAFLLNTGNMEPTLVPYFIMNESNIVKEEDYNMIISNNPVFKQDLKYNENSIILELRNDKSKIISKENVIEELLSKSKKTPSDFPNINYNSIDIINLLLPNSYFEMKSIKGYGAVKTCTLLDSKVNKGEYDNFSEYDLSNIADIFDSNIKSEIEERYKLLDHKHISSVVYTNMVNKLRTQFTEFDNPLEVKKLNDEIFTDNHLLLEYLYEGETEKR